MLLKIVRECYFIGKEEVDSSNLFNSSKKTAVSL